jgi:hypothetical protein
MPMCRLFMSQNIGSRRINLEFIVVGKTGLARSSVLEASTRSAEVLSHLSADRPSPDASQRCCPVSLALRQTMRKHFFYFIIDPFTLLLKNTAFQRS